MNSDVACVNQGRLGSVVGCEHRAHGTKKVAA